MVVNRETVNVNTPRHKKIRIVQIQTLIDSNFRISECIHVYRFTIHAQIDNRVFSSRYLFTVFTVRFSGVVRMESMPFL
jgi:hypothetical protein